MCTDLIKFNEEAEKMLNNVDVIIIDEGQFFSKLKEFCIKMVDEQHKHVIVGGLDGDAKREKFGEVTELIPIADDYIKLKAYCKICNENNNTLTTAIFTKRIQGDHTLQKDIGAEEKFIPVCRYHYLS